MEKGSRKGMVFSIERFSLHDGPGIRTTVFLKGCPMRCIWCHNPESHKMGRELQYIEEQCLMCRACEEVCPQHCHTFSVCEGMTEHKVTFDLCTACGKCTEICPAEALKMTGKRMSAQEVMQEVKKDLLYYGDQGGMTLSGGEPLLQADFCEELIFLAKKEGISVCVETAGNIPLSALKKAAGQTDLFLFDYKLSDAEQLRRYTGGDEAVIMGNLMYLKEAGKRIILRCPVIPGINDTEEHFESIRKTAEKVNAEKVEIMPYHNYGAKKWAQTGKNYSLKDLETVSDETAQKWRQLAETAKKHERSV